MADSVDISEFLSAYVCGDVQADERAAIEQLIAANPSFKATAEELRRLVLVLKQGELPVTPEMLETLKQQVQHTIAAQAGSLQKFSAFLKQHDRAVSAALSQKLIERLNDKLPLAAHVGKVIATQAASNPNLSRATIHIYATPENPWVKRVRWSAALAALVALAFGIAKLFEASQPGNKPAIAKQNDVPVPGSTKQPGINPDIPQAPREQIAHIPQTPPEPGTQVGNVPANIQAPKLAVENKTVPFESPKLEVAEAPKLPAPNTPAVPDQPALPQPADKVAQQNDPSKPKVKNAGLTPDVFVGEPPANNVASIDKTPSSVTIPAPGTSAVAQNNAASASKTPTAENEAIRAIPGVAVVGAFRATAQAKKPNGDTVTLALRSEIPSGSDIITDESRVALVLPGNGRLWVNKKTRLTLTLEGSNAAVLLQSGEVSYRAPAAGFLSLTSGNVSVTRAKAVDAKIENGALAVSVLDQSASISAKGKSLKAVAGTKAIAALSGVEAPRKETFAARPDAWTLDLTLPGEGRSNETKTITGDKAKPEKRRGAAERSSTRAH